MNQSIQLGVYHWQLFADDASFYPEDLPEDWRLSFYANEFETACIDADWILDNRAGWANLVEDLDDRFCLAIGIEHDQQWHRLHDVTEIPDQVDMLILDVTGSNHVATDLQLIHRSDCWSPEQPSASRLAVLPSSATLKQYRQWIDQWMGIGTDAEQEVRWLWLDGTKTSYRQLAELRSLIELMGY